MYSHYIVWLQIKSHCVYSHHIVWLQIKSHCVLTSHCLVTDQVTLCVLTLHCLVTDQVTLCSNNTLSGYRSTSWRGRATAASPATTPAWLWISTTTPAATNTSRSATPWGAWASTSTTTSTVSSMTDPTPTGEHNRLQLVSTATCGW